MILSFHTYIVKETNFLQNNKKIENFRTSAHLKLNMCRSYESAHLFCLMLDTKHFINSATITGKVKHNVTLGSSGKGTV